MGKESDGNHDCHEYNSGHLPAGRGGRAQGRISDRLSGRMVHEHRHLDCLENHRLHILVL